MGQGDHCRSVAWQMSPEVETLVCAVLENRPQPKALIANGQSRCETTIMETTPLESLVFVKSPHSRHRQDRKYRKHLRLLVCSHTGKTNRGRTYPHTCIYRA